MIIVKKSLRLYYGRITEHLIAIKPILVSLDIACEHQFKQIRKKIHLRAYRFHWVIETRIGIIV